MSVRATIPLVHDFPDDVYAHQKPLPWTLLESYISKRARSLVAVWLLSLNGLDRGRSESRQYPYASPDDLPSGRQSD